MSTQASKPVCKVSSRTEGDQWKLKTVRGSKVVLESLRSERYLKNLATALETQQTKMLCVIKGVWGKIGEGKGTEIYRESH